MLRIVGIPLLTSLGQGLYAPCSDRLCRNRQTIVAYIRLISGNDVKTTMSFAKPCLASLLPKPLGVPLQCLPSDTRMDRDKLWMLQCQRSVCLGGLSMETVFSSN